MNTNDTPETDAINSGEWKSLENRYDLMHDLAEQLERERNANQAMIYKLKIQLTAALEVVAKLEREKQ